MNEDLVVGGDFAELLSPLIF